MSEEFRTLRDFIYLNSDALYSLYSQVFEGVTQQVVESFEGSMSQSDSQKGAAFSGSATDARVAEVARRTEDKVLFDHMYNRLDAEISSQIIDASTIEPSRAREQLEDMPLVRVVGAAEVEDYARMRHFIDKFNDIAGAIAFAGAQGQDFKSKLAEMEMEIQGIGDRNKRARAAAQLKAKTNPKKLAAEMGLSQDEDLLSNLKMFIEMFYHDGFDITVAPIGKETSIAFRAPIERKWLRIAPEMLRALYGNYAESKWTIVGQVTYIPGVTPPIDASTEELESDSANPSMRDPFRNMFQTSRLFERMFLESKTRTEIVLQPLAIYRDVTLSKSRS